MKSSMNILQSYWLQTTLLLVTKTKFQLEILKTLPVIHFDEISFSRITKKMHQFLEHRFWYNRIKKSVIA